MSDGFLYILSEDDRDDLFYHACVERITGRNFRLMQTHLRRGGGIRQVRRMLPILMRQIQHGGQVEDTFFVVALDNDRSQRHPEHETPLDPARLERLPKNEREKPCRFCELSRAVEEVLGAARGAWPIQGAVAVPVEMLESWLLLISAGPESALKESTLPIFAEQNQSITQSYLGGGAPPQLKDLARAERQRLGLDGDEYVFHCGGEGLDVDAVALKAPSFALFVEQVRGWGQRGATS